MRITHLSTTDQAGGAARAAYRLHQGLLQIGCDSKMLVQRKITSDLSVSEFVPPRDLPTRLRRAVLGRYLARHRRALEALPQGATIFTEDRSEHGADVLDQLPGQEILNLHWCSGFFDYQTFFRKVPRPLPMVWTLHDMNAFTGGCHFDHACGKFAASCGTCPQLGSHKGNDFSAQCLQRKKNALEKIPAGRLHVVTPSRWMAGEAKKSSVLGKFDVSVIPYGLDTHVFRPMDKLQARRLFGIAADAKVILFIADSLEEKRKGLDKLLLALEGLDSQTGLHLVSLGRGVQMPSVKVPVKSLGFVRDDAEVAMAYSAADLFVAPSLQDNFPNTILEAFACGIPVISFAAGGCVEQVEHGRTGLLVPVGDHAQLRQAITGLLDNAAMRAAMSPACRQTAVDKYSLRLQAEQYQLLYQKMVQGGAS
jgi:glycosyltransferase involved in cell wall biosynthesis